MCGIAGQIAFSGDAPDPDLVSSMSARLAHRGPDGSGEFSEGPVALAHRRLAIIDPVPAGDQPMSADDGRLWIVYNGEIYNHPELRAELESLGYRFRTRTDTEVVLAAFREWGPGCLDRFNGMWAFALWDSGRRRLFCARDRLGIKPFYYAQTDDSFLFASEIKALLEDPSTGTAPDPDLLRTFLAWGVADHTGGTLFEGIYQLPPAHYMVVTPDGAGRPQRYWRLHVSGPVHGSDDPAIYRRFMEILHDAVRIRLRSDVPVGTCLSGGIDSSTITAIINRLISGESPESVGDRQKTFSVVFDDPRFDESRYIEIMTGATGVDDHRVRPSTDGLRDDLDRLLYAQDEPFGSLSIYAQYAVMRLASREVKVVLDGQGADEQLAGYLAYIWPYIRTLIGEGEIRRGLSELRSALRLHGGFFAAAAGQLLTRSRRRRLLRGEAPAVHRYAGPLHRVLEQETCATNLPLLLHYEDRNSMAFSIESRVPFCDVRLVEFIAGLPLDQKIRAGMTKYILRRSTRDLLPRAIRCRRDKMGFVTPEEVWMREVLRDDVEAIFSSPEFAGRPWWDAEAVRRDYSRFADGKGEYSPEIWRILCTELWLRKFFDEQTARQR